MNPWEYFFGWYQGGVWSNLLANIVWIPVALIGGWVFHGKLKARLDAHHSEQMQLRIKHHEELKKHLTRLVSKK